MLSRIFVHVPLFTALIWVLGSCSDGGRRELTTVVSGEIEERILLSARLSSRQNSTLAAPNVGLWPMQIAWIAEPGQVVEAGEVVVEFDSAQLVDRLEDQKNRLRASRDRLDALESSVYRVQKEAAERIDATASSIELARLKVDIPEHLIPPLELETRRMALLEAELKGKEAEELGTVDVQRAQEDLFSERLVADRLQLEIEVVSQRLEQLRLRSKRAGVALIEQNWYTNQQIAQGDNVWPGWDIVTIPELDDLQLEAWLYDVDEGRLRPGLEIEAIANAEPEVVLSGSIRSIDEIPRERGRQRGFRVLIDLASLPERRSPGLGFSVEVTVRSQGPHPLVPRSALSFVDGQPQVLGSDGEPCPITIGLCSSSSCEVLEGLGEGERIRTGWSDA